MPVRTAVLFQTHRFDRANQRRFRRLQRECPPGHEAFVLMHLPPGSPKPAALDGVPHHFVTTDAIRNPRYRGKIAGADWSVWGGGHTDLILLHFWAAHPEFDHAWVLEYDIRFTGNWGDFFNAFASNDSDFLATSVRSWRAQPDWKVWDSLVPPEGLPPEARPAIPEHGIAAFMPMFRASTRAMALMDELYAQGWPGHCEVSWGTFLHWRGLRVEDIGGHGEFTAAANRGRFYSSNPVAWDHRPGSFAFRPVRVMPGLRRNWLWHPVKPLSGRILYDLWRVQVRLERWLPQVARLWSPKPAQVAGATATATPREASADSA